jgi:hypothetical protein
MRPKKSASTSRLSLIRPGRKSLSWTTPLTMPAARAACMSSMPSETDSAIGFSV